MLRGGTTPNLLALHSCMDQVQLHARHPHTQLQYMHYKTWLKHTTKRGRVGGITPLLSVLLVPVVVKGATCATRIRPPVEQARVVLLRCPVCHHMHGRVFRRGTQDDDPVLEGAPGHVGPPVEQSINQSHTRSEELWSSKKEKPAAKRTALATLLAPLRAGGAVYQENLRTSRTSARR